MNLGNILNRIIEMLDELSIEEVKTLMYELFSEMKEIDEENTIEIIKELNKKYIR